MNALDLHVHRWLPGTAHPGAALLLLHGTGGDENDLVPLATLIAPDVSVLSLRGNVSEQGALRFFRRLAEGVFDIEDLHRRTGELADFIQAATVAYGLRAERIFMVGFSNGANIGASLLFTRPAVVGGGVLIRAMVPFEPVAAPSLAGTPVLLSEGRQDPLIPAASADRLRELLQAAGASVQMEWQPGGHQLTQADVTVARQWIGERLTG